MKALSSPKSAFAPKKQWAMPELKKIEIETITAASVGGTQDGSFAS